MRLIQRLFFLSLLFAGVVFLYVDFKDYLTYGTERRSLIPSHAGRSIYENSKEFIKSSSGQLQNPKLRIPESLKLKAPSNGYTGKHIIVTGGAGFVGSHLVDVLMKQGHYVTVLDNCCTGSKRNVKQWFNSDRFNFIDYDVSESFMLADHIPVDQIYHLASPASPPNYMALSVETLRVNLLGSINLLDLAKSKGATFLLASSSEVYGDPERHPQSESYWGHVNPIGIRSCYDEAKRAAEAITYAYSRKKGVDVRVARIFNTYGPRMQLKDGRVVSNFIFQALSNRDLTIYGDGSFTRSFGYVSDLVDGLIRLMNSSVIEPVNLGNPREFTIRELASIVKNLTGSSSRIVNLPEAENDPKRRKPDITRARQLLRWEPKVGLQEGLKATVKAFREALETMSDMGEPPMGHLLWEKLDSRKN